MTDVAPDLKPRRHRWPDEKRIPACESADGNDRTEKRCPLCGMWKITIHYPHSRIPGRDWRTKDGQKWSGDSTPPCLGSLVDASHEVGEIAAI